MAKVRRPTGAGLKVGCPFCWEWIPQPRELTGSYSGESLGGHCACGAVYVIDETGKAGGQAVMDLLTLACDGDLERALSLESGSDYEVQTKPYQGARNTVSRLRGHSYLAPQIWFLKRKQ